MNASHMPLATRDREKSGSRLVLVGPVAGDEGGRGIPSSLEPVSPVVHELDGGLFPTVLPPMYRHEWRNLSTTNTLGSDHSTAGSLTASHSLASPTATDLASPTTTSPASPGPTVTTELLTPVYTSHGHTGIPSWSDPSMEELATVEDPDMAPVSVAGGHGH
ncbi:uncharacterized protein LOC62_01G001664 [Vanrija pseudolonga]|uniref:Uncharacterized protein n=1 Tax=Vanrija pseudolonga TaxID=143232 RepID=A0AAF0Y5G4_9TREE|nr:hypothetical protein LOC62_01G001664 [Vanrija pseudolonga]